MKSMAKTLPRKNSRQGAAEANASAVATLRSGRALPRLASMNFKVTEEFRREFKTHAAQNGKSMLELLQEGFELVKERHG
jgi:hypothetical protein